MAAARRTSFEERLAIVNYYLDCGAYAPTIDRFGISYGQLYSWVSRFRRYGAAGLQDLRGTGRRLTEYDELDDVERLRIENRLLKASVKSLKEERLALKKRVAYLEKCRAAQQ